MGAVLHAAESEEATFTMECPYEDTGFVAAALDPLGVCSPECMREGCQCTDPTWDPELQDQQGLQQDLMYK